MPIDRKSLRSFNPATFAKKKIPTALKEQLWIQKCGKVFECECHIGWCVNTINTLGNICFLGISTHFLGTCENIWSINFSEILVDR